jgi:hypothetical protein
MPLEGMAELSAGASSVSHLGDPGVGDPEAGVEIPGTQLFGQLRFGFGLASVGMLYQNGLDQGAEPLKSTQPPVEAGSVHGYGMTTDFSIKTANPRLRVGLGLELMIWDVPYVEYYTCAAGEACFPYAIQAEGRDRVPTVGASLTPSYHTGDVTVFGGLTARQHPTLQQKGMDTDPLFDEPEVESGPFNFIISAGAELALAGGQVKASAIAYWDMTQNPAKYGPGVALVLAVPLGRRHHDPGATAPPPPVYPYAPPAPYPPAPAPPPYPPAPAPYPPAPAPYPPAPAPPPYPPAPAEPAPIP